MDERLYDVAVDGDIEAESMSLGTAMILVEALLDTYWRTPKMTVTIMRHKEDG